jgi:hypothetical protein
MPAARRNYQARRKYDARRKRQKEMRAAFVKVLLKSPVKDVRFSKGYGRIGLKFFGEKLSYNIVVRREAHVAEWNRRREDIYVDKAMLSRKSMRSFKALCVHEAVESFVSEKYGLNTDKEAHVVATKKEEQYLKGLGGNWRNHQLAVHHLWNRLGGH